MTVHLLLLTGLSERHPGLTKALGDSYSEAAGVCLSRHHEPPLTVETVFDQKEGEHVVVWVVPDERTERAYANEIDTTELGAYAVSLAAVEAIAGLVAVRRAETLTGADYYVAPADADLDDLESCYRLEVSGVNSGGRSALQGRLRAKLDQAAKGASNIPAIASVVGFKEKVVTIARLGVER
jgi:hypothetical protein